MTQLFSLRSYSFTVFAIGFALKSDQRLNTAHLDLLIWILLAFCKSHHDWALCRTAIILLLS